MQRLYQENKALLEGVVARMSNKTGHAFESGRTLLLWTPDFTFLCVANICVFLNNHILLPTIPLYIVHIGGNTKDVGLVMGVFTIAATMMRPIGGGLLDRYGRKKILLIGLAVTVIATVFYHAAAALMFLIFVRIVHGLSFSISSTATGTIAADILPRNRLGEGLGYFGLTNTLSMAVAPLIGLWLVGWIDKNGANKIVMAGIVALGISMVTVAFSVHITGFLLAGAAYGLGMGFCFPSLQTLAVREVSPIRRGVATGIFFSSLDLGIGLGTIIFGWVALDTSYQTMYLATTLPVLISGIFFVMAYSNKRAAGNRNYLL